MKHEGADGVIPGGDTFALTCVFNLEPEVCTWHHNSPEGKRELQDAPGSHFDILCSQAKDKKTMSKFCRGHRRISFEDDADHNKMSARSKLLKKRKHQLKKAKLSKKNLSSKSCTLKVSASTAEDAGEWRLEAMALVSKKKMVRRHRIRCNKKNQKVTLFFRLT